MFIVHVYGFSIQCSSENCCRWHFKNFHYSSRRPLCEAEYCKLFIHKINRQWHSRAHKGTKPPEGNIASHRTRDAGVNWPNEFLTFHLIQRTNLALGCVQWKLLGSDWLPMENLCQSNNTKFMPSISQPHLCWFLSMISTTSNGEVCNEETHPGDKLIFRATNFSFGGTHDPLGDPH